MFTSCRVINLSVYFYSFIIIVTFLLKATDYSARFTIVCLSPPHEAWIRRGKKKQKLLHVLSKGSLCCSDRCALPQHLLLPPETTLCSSDVTRPTN